MVLGWWGGWLVSFGCSIYSLPYVKPYGGEYVILKYDHANTQ